MLNLPWQGFGNKTFTKIEAYAGMAERLVRDLAIEEALQDKIKDTLEHKNQSHVNWCALSDKGKITTSLKLPLHMIWAGRRDHLVGDMTPLTGMTSSLVGEARGSFEWSSIPKPVGSVILQKREDNSQKNIISQRTSREAQKVLRLLL